MGEEANCNIVMEAAVAAKAMENGNGHAGATEAKAAPAAAAVSGVVDPRLQGISDAIRVVPHFPKPGIMFNDITTLLLLPGVFKGAVDIFVERYRCMGIDAVAGIEARGFIFGPAIALAIGAKFIPLRKPKKLPGEVISETYVLEYGSDCLEMHVGAIEPGFLNVLEPTLLSALVSLGSQNLRISTSSMVRQYMCWWSPANMKNKKLMIRNAHDFIPCDCK
ncbi:hypothetical protein GUJ93_ZPchr0002g25330 [Zizania palustris]|uniref:adenine phosphoribosyltransferase n=1 Tax=Zizania palustris TaxID=103762 RepID=A0A8J5RII6_ZIZPA|nr:hypothetical protein GUJ93_ZPchr0002g25330 [Zizania palustris]